MKLSAGDVLLARFPFTDLSGEKRRPVLVLSLADQGEDVIVCAITSRPHDGPYDVPIVPDERNGLKVSSWVQFDKIATLSLSVISGRIGAVSPAFMQAHKPLLLKLFGLNGA
jgi:mRNA interferase MazF